MNNKIIIITTIIVILAVILLIGYNALKNEKIVYKKISMNEAVSMMENSNLIILDVRTKEEYDEGHIPNAINIPNETINNDVTNNLADKKQTILIYCRSGNRSRQATEKLMKMGYINVIDIGGINNWTKKLEK